MTRARRRSPTGWCASATAGSARRRWATVRRWSSVAAGGCTCPPTCWTGRRTCGPTATRTASSSRPRPAAVVAELASVHKSFGARTVFDGFSAEFHRGLLTTIAGRSGTGKSTLLHMLAGLERSGGGEVLVCGESLGRLDREGLAEVRRRHIAVVGQDPGLVAFMS